MKTKTLSPELVHKINGYWRAANYQSVGQIYLYDNSLMKQIEHKQCIVKHGQDLPEIHT